MTSLGDIVFAATPDGERVFDDELVDHALPFVLLMVAFPLSEMPERAKSALDALRSEGIAIALDDFGTGYSSIGYLRQFQFDRVKLDRSIVADIDRDLVQAALVESTMSYAFAMGLSVTAEGVERREEAVALQRLGCREFQGYLFARPMGLTQLTRLLTETPERKAG